MGSTKGASGENQEAREGRIPNRLATTDKQPIARVFGIPTRPRRNRDVGNCGFPIRGTNQTSQGLLQPRVGTM